MTKVIDGPAMRLLLLGGTSEASALARHLAGDRRFAATLSLAGRTANPQASPLPIRIGGFGGAEGLAAYLAREHIDVLVDATHPFAAVISRNAATAAASARIPLLAVRRPAWQPEPADRWSFVPSLEAAASALPATPSRIFLAVGRQGLAPFAARPEHHYVVRLIDPPDPPCPLAACDIVMDRGPFRAEDDIALLRDRSIDIVVCKNSGGTAAVSKLEAARALALPVILVDRPQLPSENIRVAESLAAALAQLTALHQAFSTKRSV